MVQDVAKPPKTVRKLRAVFPPAKPEDGVAWHTFGIAFPSFCPTLGAGFFVSDTRFLSCSACFFFLAL